MSRQDEDRNERDTRADTSIHLRGPRLTVRLRHTSGELWYAVDLDDEATIEESRIGIGGTFGDFYSAIKSISCAETQSLSSQEYRMHVGKAHHVDSMIKQGYISWRCHIENESLQWLDLDFALSNTTVAFRSHIPDPGSYEVPVVVHGRSTSFCIHKSYGDFQLVQPYDAAKSQYQSFYQPRDDRDLPAIGSSDSRVLSPDGFGLPALFKTSHGNKTIWVMVKESGFDGNYPASHISNLPGKNCFSLEFPFKENGNDAMGSPVPQSLVPWTTPWIVLTITTSLRDIISDTSVTDFALPIEMHTRTQDEDWIQPGSASWSWFANASNTLSFEATKAYINLAADQHWTYSLLDAGWDRMTDDSGRPVSLEEINAYAASKDVRLWVWMNSAGPNNIAYDVTPRDMLYDPDIRRKTMSRLRKLNIAGIKVDGVESEKQGMMRYLLDILADAAEFHLMIVFHNCPVPHGWERTWPNLISSEGLVTSEYYTSSKVAYAAQMPENNVNEAFTRLTIGPADYAPGTFSQLVDPFDAPLTTFAHEMALHVIIDTGLRCFPESRETYATLMPDPSILPFLTSIPFVWDETRFLAGEPGKYFVVAKRSGNHVYVAGINSETSEIAESIKNNTAVGVPRLLTVELGHFGSAFESGFAAFDQSFDRLPRLGIEDYQFSDEGRLKVWMAPFGGFIAVLVTNDTAPVLLSPLELSVDGWSSILLMLLALSVLTVFVIIARRHRYRRASGGKYSK